MKSQDADGSRGRRYALQSKKRELGANPPKGRNMTQQGRNIRPGREDGALLSTTYSGIRGFFVYQNFEGEDVGNCY